MTELAETPELNEWIPSAREADASEQLNEDSHRLSHFGKAALKATGWILGSSPLWVAGGVTSVELGPSAHVTIADSDVSTRPDFGSDTSSLHAPNIINASSHAHTRLLGRDIGASVAIDGTNLPITNPDGSYSMQKIQQTVEIFGDISVEKARVEIATRDNLYKSFTVGAAAVLLAESSGFLIIAWSRRRQSLENPLDMQAIRDYNKPYRKASATVATGLSLGLLINAGYTLFGPDIHHQLNADPALNGTPLHGWEVSGNAQGLIDDVVPFALSWVHERNAFYNQASANVQNTIEHLKNGGDDLTAKPADTLRWVVADDFQGVSGMEQVVGTLAKSVKANAIIDNGDTSFSGSSWESPSIDTLRHYAGPHIRIVAALGRHDSPEIAKLMQEQHYVVGNDRTQTIDGVTMLIGNDPWISPLGFPTHLINPNVDTSRKGEILADESCRTHPVLAIVHDKDIGSAIAARNCAQLVLTGRSFDAVGPLSTIGTKEYISGSAGAHGEGDGPEIGIIHKQATFSIIDYNKATKTFTYRLVSTMPDTSVTISPDISIHVTYSEYESTGRTMLTPTDIHIEHSLAEGRKR